ncbi:MAG TPA: L-2-hydroxyglutarate oxidase [Deltaproteobacteria bacterium]|nr:MAG: aminobutyraldehyde dehydrogenase [Deltaproteobacteria bacterium GWA2_55_82]OGQ63145.1 MAG: aminobutyraldehyde dehydrogenase [Deltaproteobacteria bacterium RIFCSPLOWO2_02_FULL_55_12]OIJ73610.1 MAG: aminobutyraldehyde dehydrogenase [Deltaproteobacteria bacterium GWC2_55_46]HBG47747.1 L-2-hydroxyglutarate oxidase [Deltaproteobacteria bacterium]HCY12031.1 L-2-hydroxyglutarate oxidase [Deltaproteobacteria bacterium]
MDRTEILICGAGIVGLTIARELALRGYRDITVIEKEDAPGRHASGRMSGVLHAGVYYSPGSMRAECCASGNRLMKEYCRRKGVPLVETGKVIVAKNESEAEAIEGLYRRAAGNGADVEIIDEARLGEIEPFARTSSVALFCRDTAVIDPKAVLACLQSDLAAAGVRLLTATSFLGLAARGAARTSMGNIGFGLFINAAGAYSDRVAHAFGAGIGLKLIPFKGIYRRLKEEKARLVKGNIYPVPDPRNPFLGVHFTRSSSGEVFAGPTAMPAFGRENYGVLSGLSMEALEIIGREAALFAVNRPFRDVAISETGKYLPGFFYRDARSLVNGLSSSDLEPSSKAGIRPQLVDWEKKELVMDFLVEGAEDSIHILNAISPAFTCSMEFAKRVVSGYVEKDGRGL